MGPRAQRAGVGFQCPCCWCFTLDQPAAYVICPVCFWEDDGQDDPHAGEVWGGPNGALSLTQARDNYVRYEASSQEAIVHVREPASVELPVTGPVALPFTVRSVRQVLEWGRSEDSVHTHQELADWCAQFASTYHVDDYRELDIVWEVLNDVDAQWELFISNSSGPDAGFGDSSQARMPSGWFVGWERRLKSV